MKTEIYTAYAETTDMTFIMCDTYNGDDLVSTEVIGFYYGMPEVNLTNEYIGNLKAEY